MDKPAAALACTVGLLLLLIWQQFVRAAMIAVGANIKAIVVVAIIAVGLSVYMKSHASR